MSRFHGPMWVWINAPSSLQSYHGLHGMEAIIVPELTKEDEGVLILIPGDKAVTSMYIPEIYLAPGRKK